MDTVGVSIDGAEVTMPQPYWTSEDGRIVIYHGDCLDVLPQLADGSVDLILTDPPYNVSDRGAAGIGGLRRADGTFRHIALDFGAWDHGFDATAFLAHCPRLLRVGGSLISFVSEFTLPAYLQSGLDHQRLIAWEKTNPAPSFRRTYVGGFEFAVWQTKGGKWTWNEGGYRPNVFRQKGVSGWSTVNDGEARAHPTQKPLGLIRKWMRIHSNADDLILDPFGGSMTTLRAALDLGRRAIGIELNEDYCRRAVERMRQAVLL